MTPLEVKKRKLFLKRQAVKLIGDEIRALELEIWNEEHSQGRENGKSTMRKRLHAAC